jgi:ABC-type ATPase involved in cell division
LVATHEQAVVESLPFRRIVIERGRLRADGSAR